MADYPADLVRTRYLFDGSQVTIRPIRPDDAGKEQDFVRRLSKESRYKRFMGTLKELSPDKLRYFTEVDYDKHLALVAIVDQAGEELEIGVARYVIDPGGERCEFAIVVDDAWQGTGIAGVLMLSLIDAARARGLRTMVGQVLASNDKMIKFSRQLGFTVHHDPNDPETVRVERPL
jgi:GNAT superfamily N-acetyltransferase